MAIRKPLKPQKPQTQVYVVVHPGSAELTIWPSPASVGLGGIVLWTLRELQGDPRSPEAELRIPAAIPKGEFLLLFDDVAGFGTVEVRSDGGQARATARGRGIYHYRVAAAVGARVYADLYCPSIIIQ